MRRCTIFLLGFFTSICWAQQTSSSLPDAPTPSTNRRVNLPYTPPTQGQRFKTYLHHTYGIYSIVEAGARAGIDQARDAPSEWPQGGQGYADRFGSAMGDIAVRGTTEYLVADIFREDLRYTHCDTLCSQSRVRRALEDTFTARKGDDGHRAFSVARFVGPVVGGAVTTYAWYPRGYGGAQVLREASVSYGFRFVRNYVWQLIH